MTRIKILLIMLMPAMCKGQQRFNSLLLDNTFKWTKFSGITQAVTVICPTFKNDTLHKGFVLAIGEFRPQCDKPIEPIHKTIEYQQDSYKVVVHYKGYIQVDSVKQYWNGKLIEQ